MGEASLAGAAFLLLLFGNGSGSSAAPAVVTQPAIETGDVASQPSFRGWNVVSIYTTQWQAADDWQNVDDNPVTGFNWLGSYVSWTQTTLPPVTPTGFWFGIYDNLPADVDVPYARPGNLVWSYSTDTFTQEFAGYSGLDHGILDSTFRYSYDIPEQDWFFPDGIGSTNWLTIAAYYEGDVPPVYQWGWQTRPNVIGSSAVWLVGDPADWVPLRWDGQDWDTAFELKGKTPGPIIPECNSMGLVAIASGLVSLFRLPLLRRR